MDISKIDVTKVNSANSIVIGNPNATKTVVEYLNLRCPWSKLWFQKNDSVLATAVSSGKVNRHIKLLNKFKEPLKKGNIVHQYIPSDPLMAYLSIKSVFDNQEQWKSLDDAEIPYYLESELHLHHQQNAKMLANIVTEAEETHVQFVPSIVVGHHVFDESISPENLSKLLN